MTKIEITNFWEKLCQTLEVPIIWAMICSIDSMGSGIPSFSNRSRHWRAISPTVSFACVSALVPNRHTGFHFAWQLISRALPLVTTLTHLRIHLNPFIITRHPPFFQQSNKKSAAKTVTRSPSHMTLQYEVGHKWFQKVNKPQPTSHRTMTIKTTDCQSC